MTNKTDIYDVGKYTDIELYNILDLTNPTDRELEAKIHFFLNKYEQNQSPDGRKLYKFFNDIYTHLFDLSDQELDQELDPRQEGFATFFLEPVQEGFDISFNGLETSNQITGKKSEDTIYDNKTKSKPGTQPDISFNIGTQDLTTINPSSQIGSTSTTKSVDYIPGNLNPLLKETIKRIISIDSQFRDQSTYPLSTDFTFNLSDTLSEVVSLKLYSVQIPYSWYTINANFGSNFFYLKGVSPGINDGNSDYQIKIPSGNYTAITLVAAVNASISNLYNSLTEVDLSNTQLSYNASNAKSTMIVKIAKCYNDINYKLVFPVTTDPYQGNVQMSPSRFDSISGFLGLNTESTNCTYNIYSSAFTNNINNITNQTKISIDATDCSFNIIIYNPTIINGQTSNYITGTTTIIQTIPVSIPFGSYINILQIMNAINLAFSQNPILAGSTMSINTYNISLETTNTAAIPTSILNPYTTSPETPSYKFKINIKLNRQKIAFTENMKAIIQFPDETKLWSPILQFNTTVDKTALELNNIISDVDTLPTTLSITNSPYIYLKCNKEYYGNNGIAKYDSGTIEYATTTDFKPTITKLLTGNVFINTDINGNTININPSNLTSQYYIGGTTTTGNTYTLTGDEYTLINKIQKIYGNVQLNGNNITVRSINGNSYTVTDIANTSNPTIFRDDIKITGSSKISSNIAYSVKSINSNDYSIDTSSRINLTGTTFIRNGANITSGNISINTNSTGTNSIVSLFSNAPYSISGTINPGNIIDISGNLHITGQSHIKSTDTLSINSNRYILSPTYDSNTQFDGSANITSGNITMNSTNPYAITCADKLNSFELQGNPNINLTGDVNLTGNIKLFSSTQISIKGSDCVVVNKDTNTINQIGITYITFGNIEINGNNYQIATTPLSNYVISRQQSGDIITVNGNASIYTGPAQIKTNNPYIIWGSEYSIDGNISLTGQTNFLKANIQIGSTSDPYSIEGTRYSIVGNVSITGNTTIIGNVIIHTPGNIDISGSQYSLKDGGIASIEGNLNITSGDINIQNTLPYSVTGNSYKIIGPANITSDIAIFGGNLRVLSTNDKPFIIFGNDYSISSTSSPGPTYTLSNKSYQLSGNSIIHGNQYNVYGNVNIYQDNSLNDYIIGNISNTNYLLEGYIKEVNTKMQTWNGVYNSTGSSSISISPASMINFKFDIVNTIDMTNYKVDLSKSFLGETSVTGIMKFPNTLDLNTGVIYTSDFLIANSYIIGLTDTITIIPQGTKNKYTNPIELNIQPKTYKNIVALQNAINQIFNQPNNGTSFTGSNIQLNFAENNKVHCILTLKINTLLTENDYSVYFYDNDLSNNSIQYKNMPNFYGYIINNWQNSTWANYLKLASQKYDLTTKSNQLYAEFDGSGEIFSNLVHLDNSNNYFYINPIFDPSGGVYTLDGTNSNNIRIDTGLIGDYSKESLTNAINTAFANNPLTAGSTIQFITINNLQYTVFRFNINKIFKTSDFMLNFYDPVSFTSCALGSSGKSSIRNATWDSTLGWILGFRNLTQYYLTPANQIGTDIITNYDVGTILSTYYSGYINTLYNTSANTAYITGDTCTSIYLYSYFMIILDDYVQNHLNDGLVTITNIDNDIPLPSYANRSSFRCDPVTKQLVATSVLTNYNNLTNNQLYAANQILNVKQNQHSNYSAGPFVQDIFGLIPVKTTGLVPGQTYIEFGGTLQIQERTYFGPVNIRRMTIKLLTDKGDVVSLNGANWSFSLICEQLYTNPNKSASK